MFENIINYAFKDNFKRFKHEYNNSENSTILANFYGIKTPVLFKLVMSQ